MQYKSNFQINQLVFPEMEKSQLVRVALYNPIEEVRLLAIAKLSLIDEQIDSAITERKKELNM